MRAVKKLAAVLGLVVAAQVAMSAPIYSDYKFYIDGSQVSTPDLYDWQTQVDTTDKAGWVSGVVGYTVTGSFQEVGNGTNPYTVQIPEGCVDPVVLLHWGGGGGPKDTVVVEGLAAGSSYAFKYSYTKTPPGSLFTPGISGYGVYCGSTTVPDGGATAALLGLGLLGLGWVQRRR